VKVLTVNPEIPKNAGKAKLEFFKPTSADAEPHRAGSVIWLPLCEGAEFHPLVWQTQFLFRVPNQYRPKETAELYFGGTDEEPFLVRLRPVAFSTFSAKGEREFFEELKPPYIRKLEAVFQSETKRQGDIFAVPIGFPWETISAFRLLQTEDASSEQREPLITEEESMFGTRHLFTGLVLDVQLPTFGTVQCVEGTLQAPDHKQLTLHGVHVLGQTTHLWNPEKAD
jgi:hypothetical protein